MRGAKVQVFASWGRGQKAADEENRWGTRRTYRCGGDPAEVCGISLPLRVHHGPPSSELLGKGWDGAGKC